MKVNIVMLVCNRPRLTRQALESLYNNTPKGVFNLTVIDDGSSSRDSELLAREMQHKFKNSGRDLVWVTLQPSVGVTGRVRNLGVYWADKHWGRGDWLYLSDNDVYFLPDWLSKLTSVLARGGLMRLSILGGWNHPFLKPSSKDDIPIVNISRSSYIHSHDAVTGASQLMRWSVWDEFGPLDAHAKGVGQSEDWAMCRKIINAGGRVGSIYPRVVLNCGVTNSFGEPSTGAEEMKMELMEHRGVIWE